MRAFGWLGVCLALGAGCGDDGAERPPPPPARPEAPAEVEAPAPDEAPDDAPDDAPDEAPDDAPDDAPDEAPAVEEAAPAAEGAAGEVELHAAEGLRLVELVLARGVEERAPVDPTTRFERRRGRIYAFARVENDSGAASALHVTFEPADGGPAGGVTELDIPAMPRWKTWAMTGTGRAPGAYVCVVRAPGGGLLGRAPFEIVEE